MTTPSFNHPSIFSKPLAIIGHRGAAGHAPENSLEAFEIASAARVDGIELDVKYTHDELIVFHDDDLERLTQDVGDINLASPSKLNELRLKNGEPIPNLEQVWDITPPNIVINIELKGANTAAPVCDFIRKHSHRYIVSSFLIDELRLVKELLPDIPRALLRRQREPTTSALATELDVCNVHIMDHMAQPDVIQPLLDHGFHVFVFTVNDVKRASELQAMGVSAIFTDLPRLFR